MLLHASSRVRGSSTASFVHFAKQQTSRRQPRHRSWLSQLRWQSGAAIATETTTTNAQASSTEAPSDASSIVRPINLSVQSKRRLNEIGVQHLSSHMYKQIFLKDDPPAAPKELVELSKRHLELHNLYGKNTDNTAPIGFDVPKLQGNSLDEHFHKLGIDCGEPFLSYAKQFAEVNPPNRPKKWIRRSGWTKYPQNGSRPKAEGPDKENMLCFDVEVLYKDNPFAIMACAMSPTAWYVWLSPWLLGESENKIQLIPLGNPNHDRVIVGHNIGYDRGRILEEYDLKQTRNAFLDTMSLHVAVNGMCSQQRPTWLKHKKNRELRDKITKETKNTDLAALLASDDFMEDDEDLWVERSSINSLRDVANFHLKETIDKEIRNDFGELDRAGILGKLSQLLDYCADDVQVTQRVYQKVFPNFLEVCPHPVSFAALRHLSSVILPVNRSWDEYIKNAEAKYEELSHGIQERLVSLAEKAAELKKEEEWMADPWLRQLDWSEIGVIKYVGGKKKNDPVRLDLRQKKPGMPKWYKGLFPKRDEPMKLTVRTRIAPLLLRLTWDGFPLTWSDKYGWMVRVPLEDAAKYSSTQLVQCELFDEPIEMVRDDTTALYFKLPHKDGPAARCTNPLTKSYLSYFDKGILSSEYSYAKEALEMNASCSYWISARARIRSQMVVYESDKNPDSADRDRGYIIPQIIPMGTITRRAVENTWLTASNAKKNRVGSELKAMVKAPEGYSFVGADVDSEELWIASVIGDATFKLHGGNAIGFMTLEGTKAAGTDLHSRTASILGITRNDAKVFNYGRIYGAGVKFAATLLRQFDPSLSEQETLEIAGKLYANTKGTKTSRRALYKRPFWRGGTESFVFNKLEEFAEQERPRTPVLGAGITEALMRRFISKGGYLTSRINWAIQSSGVDYLHLLIVGMDYLIRRFNIQARLAITVHDEIRYLVKNEDKYRAAMALQVANLWTRAMFAQQVGIDDLPQSCAYFSAVDIDHVLRKEVDMNCVTPSHQTPIAPGESLDITQLLERGADAFLDPDIVPAAYAPNLENIPYTPRIPVMQSLAIAQDATDLSFLKAQITDNNEELRTILQDQKKALAASVPKIPRPRKGFTYHSQKGMPTMYQPFKAHFPRESDFGSDGWVFEKMPPETPRTSRPRL